MKVKNVFGMVPRNGKSSYEKIFDTDNKNDKLNKYNAIETNL